MKSPRYTCTALLVAIITLATARAELNGNDGFEGSALSTNSWLHWLIGGGLLTQSNQHLIYQTTGAPTASDADLLIWRSESGDVDRDWVVQLDVAVPDLSFQPGQGVQIGLVALKAGGTLSFSNSMTVFLGISHDFHGFESGIFAQGARVNTASTDSISTAGAVRLRWQAASRSLTAEYDSGGAVGGYNWTPLASRIIGPGVFDWGLSASSKFQVAILGNSQNMAVLPSDGASADNFICYPTLKLRPAMGTVRLSWSTNAAGFGLQACSPIVQSQSWTNVNQLPGIVGGDYQVEDTGIVAGKAYRLRR